MNKQQTEDIQRHHGHAAGLVNKQYDGSTSQIQQAYDAPPQHEFLSRFLFLAIC